MMTVTNSRTFIETNGLSRKRRVRWTILIRNCICHQNLNLMEKPPAPSKELSPIVAAKGVRGMRCAMGVSQSMPESGLSLWQIIHGLAVQCFVGSEIFGVAPRYELQLVTRWLLKCELSRATVQ